VRSAIWKQRSRWSDNDHTFGPFLYARDGRGYRPISIMFGTGDWDERRGCDLRLSAFGHTLIIALPPLLKPWHRKVYPGWDAATVERLGRDWYWDSDERQFGFTIAEGALHVHYGRQANDSRDDKTKVYFFPWRCWRPVRHSLYDLSGDHFYTLQPRRHSLGDAAWHNHWTAEQAIEAACPAAVFEFADYDGEHILATTRIEEREWLLGEGRFKWLSMFRKPNVARSLDICFSSEVGKRKGSWKGGTIGHSITMKPDELHEAAFRRYCAENNLTFVGAKA
jgi:hypothetical protein